MYFLLNQFYQLFIILSVYYILIIQKLNSVHHINLNRYINIFKKIIRYTVLRKKNDFHLKQNEVGTPQGTCKRYKKYIKLFEKMVLKYTVYLKIPKIRN